MRTDVVWREFAAQMLMEKAGGSPTQLGRLLGVAHTTARRWVTEGIIPSRTNLDAISELTGVDPAELWEIIQRSQPVDSVSVDSLPVIVQELITVALRLPRRQQQELLTFAQFRAEQAQ